MYVTRVLEEIIQKVFIICWKKYSGPDFENKIKHQTYLYSGLCHSSPTYWPGMLADLAQKYDCTSPILNTFRECIRFWNGANIIYAYWQHMRIFGIKGLKDYIIIILTVTTHHLQSHWRPASIRFRSYAKIACINWHRELNEYHRILVRIRIKGLKREWTITWVISSRRHEQTTGQNVKIIMLI